MQDVKVLRLEATQLVNQLPVDLLQQAVDILKSLFRQSEPIETKEKPEPQHSEAILASSRSWSDIPDEEFNQLLRDVYEQRRMQNSQIGKPEPKSNGPTMAEMLERLQIINEEEPIELEIPPRVNRPIDFSFLEDDDDATVETDNPAHFTASGETHAISL